MESREVSINYSTTDVDESGVRIQEKHEFAGRLLKKGDIYYVSYKMCDDEGNLSSVLLKIHSKWMSYKVSGTSSADMEFKEGTHSKCDYRTPVGNIPMCISTDCYRQKDAGDELEAFVRYELMTIDGGHIANREIKIIIGLN